MRAGVSSLITGSSRRVARRHFAKEATSNAAPSATTSPSPTFPHMLSPLDLGPAGVLPNRVVMGSMHTGMEDFGVVRGSPFTGRGGLTDLAEFFAERARGGVGLIVTGGVAPNRQGKVSPLAGKMSNGLEARAHREVTEAVHDTGDSKIVMQILHSGRYGYHWWNVAPSPVKAPIGWFTPKELSPRGIESTIDDFVKCAELARSAGYDGVEVMGSEGYLLNQFIAAHTNKRTDAWGGSYENRIRLPVEIVSRMRRAVGDDFIIMFRLSMLDLIEQGSSWTEIVMLAKALEKAGASIINTGIGWHEARIPTIATKVPRAAFAWVTEKMMEEKRAADGHREHGDDDSETLTIPLCATNRINMPDVAEALLASGQADLVSMARPFLADPMIVKKAAEGRVEEINTCIGCNQACLDFTFKGMRSSCLVNPTAGYEREMKEEPVPEDQVRNIAVVGAGPAGLSFATTAARRGHKVTLFEAGEEIGGQFNMAKRIPGKEEFYETLRYFRARLELDGVVVRLNEKVSAEDLIQAGSPSNTEDDKAAAGGFDTVVMATGVTPRSLENVVPGMDHPSVLSYVDVLARNKPVGQKVAVIGAGGIGFDVAEFLAHSLENDTADRAQGESIGTFMSRWGVDRENVHRGGLLPEGKNEDHWGSPREVTLLQRSRKKHGADLGKTTGWIHRAGLKNSGVSMLGGVTYKKVDADGNLHIEIATKVDKKTKKTIESEERVLEVDNIVVCAGQEPLRELQAPLGAAGLKVFRIGGAENAGDLDANRAFDQGTRLALKVETAQPGEVFERPLGFQASIIDRIRALNPTGAK